MSTAGNAVPLDTYWGIIQSGARARLTTGEIWSAIRHSVDLAGESLAPGSFQRMNQLRGLAGQQLRADVALARAGHEETITSQHISTDINSRDGLQRSLSPRYRVTFDVEGTSIRTGERQRFRLTDTFGPNLPATKSELMDQLAIEAPATVDAYGFVLDQVIGNLSIREV